MEVYRKEHNSSDEAHDDNKACNCLNWSTEMKGVIKSTKKILLDFAKKKCVYICTTTPLN